jgi:hypothetical protein
VPISSDNKFNLNANEFVGNTIERLFDQNEKPALDAIFDSPSRCSAELVFTIRGQSILIAVSKDFNGDELVLECSYIMYVFLKLEKNIDFRYINNFSQEHRHTPFDSQPSNVDRKLSNVSDKNFNYQQTTMFSPHASNYQMPDTSAQSFQYSSFQVISQNLKLTIPNFKATQQPQMQSVNLFTENFEPANEEAPTNQTTKKPRYVFTHFPC